MEVHGCNFHYTQATLKKRRELGLGVLYHTNSEVKKTCDLLDALAFLPVDMVMDGEFILPVCAFIYKTTKVSSSS